MIKIFLQTNDVSLLYKGKYPPMILIVKSADESCYFFIRACRRLINMYKDFMKTLTIFIKFPLVFAVNVRRKLDDLFNFFNLLLKLENLNVNNNLCEKMLQDLQS